MFTITLKVTIDAATEETAQDMLAELARAAADIANSTEDTQANIWMEHAQS